KKARTPGAISPDELKEGCLAFQQRERRDAMYKPLTFGLWAAGAPPRPAVRRWIIRPGNLLASTATAHPVLVCHWQSDPLAPLPRCPTVPSSTPPRCGRGGAVGSPLPNLGSRKGAGSNLWMGSFWLL